MGLNSISMPGNSLCSDTMGYANPHGEPDTLQTARSLCGSFS